MATVVVTAANTNTRVNASDANTNWSNLGGGGPAPASEAQLRYQGTGAVNRKVTSTTARQGVQYDPGASALDMTAAANALWIAKGYVADFGDLNTTYGVEYRLGSGSGAYYDYNVAGSGANRSVFNAYPAQGGYLIVAIDPNVSAWREGTTGSPVLTAVDYFGMAAQFVAGGAKSENMALDAIDVGTGLQLYAGDGADADGTFDSFPTTDQDNTSNRWGYATRVNGVIVLRGMMTVGTNNVTSTATEFTDNTSVVVFPDGYHSAGLFGTTWDLGSASTVINIGCRIIGLGSSTTEDTRPDFIVTGTSGTLTLSGTVRNHRNVTLTSACELDSALVNCELLTQNSCDIVDSEIVCNAVASIACLQDPTFGTTTDLRDTEFVQGGAGHAIELDTATTYNMQGIVFTGFNASNNQDDSALDITASSGTVTINISGGGSTPSYRTAGATVVINNTVTLSVHVEDSAGSNISGARVRIEEPDGTLISAGTTNASGDYSDGSYNYVTDQDAVIKVRFSPAAGPRYIPFTTNGTITTNGLTVEVTMQADTIAS